MFSVKNKSNIRQVTPYGEFDSFESKAFYPVSKVYANAKEFFLNKHQFDVWQESLPILVEQVTTEAIPALVEQVTTEEIPSLVVPVPTEEIPKKEEGEVITTESALDPVVAVKTKAKRSLE